MKPIVPKGYNINEYPRSLDPSQLAVREASKTLNEAAETVVATEKIIDSVINNQTYSQFFSAHFGTKPLQAIKAMYFPQGHTVKQGGGTGNTLSIAQEMMEYKNPAPTDYGLEIEVLIALLNSIMRIPAQQADDAVLRQTRLAFVEEAVFKLEVRPTRESMVAARELPGNWKPRLSNYTRTSYFKKGINSFDGKYGYVQGAKMGSVAPVWMERPHTAGFNIILNEVINHYEEVYQINNTAATPRHFWEANSKKRLGVEIDGNFDKGNYTVKVFNVDPATGAPRGRGRAVARAPITNYQGNPGFLLAKVKQHLFPEVYLLSDGVAMHEGERENHYKDQLVNANNMWEGIPDKAKTPIACVIEQSFTYTYVAGQPRPEAPSKDTSIAVNSMKLYLQPTGIEEAMKRILDISHPAGNAIEKWVVTDLFPNTTVVPLEDNKHKYSKSNIKQVDWNAGQIRFNRTLQLVYNLLDNPHICSDGLAALKLAASNPSVKSKLHLFGAFHWFNYVPEVRARQMMNDVLKIFSYADWPQAAPQLIFSAPIDEEKDLNMLLNMFKNYMNENTTTASPGQMYSPESFNGRLDSVSTVGQDSLWNYNFGFSKYTPSPIMAGGLFSYAYKRSPPTRVRATGVSQPTIRKKQRYNKGTKTVVTGKVVADSVFPMPPTIEPPQQQSLNLTGTSETSLSQINTAVIVAGGGFFIALGIAAIHMARK